MGAAICTRADTTIDPTNRYAFGANVSWLDWLGDTNHGVVIGSQVCSGHVFSPNLGWINFGNGSPTNGLQYQNLSANDFGVNVDGSGNLRGFAYGANIGWINFETNGAAKVDLASGKLGGFAFSATCGWISLSNEVAFVQTRNPPVIFSPPQSQITTIGQPALFRVVAGGLPPLSYQWFFNGTSIPGATVSEFSRANSQAADAGEYSVVITNAFGSVTSAVAILLIGYPEIAVEQPAGSVLADGVASINFGTVLAGGNSQLTFAIRNPGNGELLSLAISIDGPDAGEFSVAVSPPTNVPAGGSASFIVKFNPNSSGTKVAALHLTNNDADESPFDIALSGSVQPPAGSGTILTIAGNGSGGFAGDGGVALNAGFSSPSGLAIGPDGTLYVADSGNYRVRAINPANGTIWTVAGNGPPPSGFCEDGPNGDGGPATNAQICDVFSLAVDRQRNTLYVPGVSLARVRQVNLASGLILNFAGVGQFSPYPIGHYGDGGPATGAWFVFPWGVAVGRSNDVFIVDGGHCRLRKVDGSTGVITTVAGRDSVPGVPVCESAGDDGPANLATLGNPQRVTADSAGNVFVVDSVGQTARVRRIDALTGIITHVAGGGTNAPGVGPATNMNLGYISDIALSGTNLLFIANQTQVFQLNLATGLLAVFAGDGTAGFSGDNGPALSARFNEINGITVAPGGGLVIADSLNQRIRYVVPDSINLSGDGAQVAFYLPWASSISGDIIIVSNSGLSTVSADSVTSVGGSLVVTGNTSMSDVSFGSLHSAGGSVEVSGNPSAATISMSSLSSAGGDLTVTSNAPNTSVDLSSLCRFGNDTNATVMLLQGGTFTFPDCLTIGSNATLAGDAILDGSLTNNGRISPGSSPGRFNITGNLVLNPSSELRLELGGFTPRAEFDCLSVKGNVTLGGTLAVSLISGFQAVMTNGASFTVLTAGGLLNGGFANAASGQALVTSDGLARFTVRYSGENTLRLTDFVILNLDSDGDGVPDPDELRAGTDPHNPASVFRILGIQREGAGVRITWSTVGGKSYLVQTTMSANGSFTDFGPVISMPGVGESITNIVDLDALTNGAERYYRVRLGP
jgi:hypothetical protein